MSKSPKTEPGGQKIETRGDNSAATWSGDIYQNNIYGKTDFDEISFEDLESQIQELPKIQPDFLNQLKEHRMLVLGGELGGINKNELILQLAYLLAKDSSQKADISIKFWRHSSSQQIIDLELELRNRKTPTIFVFTDIEPKDINCSLQHIFSEVIPSLEHWVLFSTNRSFSSWHLNDDAQIFFNPNLSPQDIYGEDILVNELENKLGENLKLELNKYLKNDDRTLELIAKNLGSFGNILRFVKLFDRKIQESPETPTDININDLIKESKSDAFIRGLFQNILSDRQQLMALGISFFNGMFEDQLFTALEKVFTEAWRKRHPSLIALDYSDLEELIYNYFDFQENDLYEGVSNIFKDVKTKTYKIDIRSINILSLGNRDQLFEIAWQSHRRQIINALEVLVNIVKESALEKNSYLPEKWDLYRNPIRREKVRKAITNTFSSIGVVSINVIDSSLLQLATDENREVRAVAASVIASWYEVGKKEEVFRILQSFYDVSLEKEKVETGQQGTEKEKVAEEDNVENQDESEVKKVEELEKQNIISKVIDPLLKLFRGIFGKYIGEVKKQKKEKYYIDKGEDFQDYIGATVAVTIGNVIYEHHRNENLSSDLYDWLKELSKSRLRLVHLYFGYSTLSKVVPLHLKQTRAFLKEIVQDHRDWLYKKYDLSLNHAVAISLTYAYNYPENRQEVKDILETWYQEAGTRYGEIESYEDISTEEDNLLTKEDALLRTIALTYGLIKYDDEIFPILLQNACLCLENIFNMDKHILLREAVITAVLLLVNKYLGGIEEWLSGLVSNFSIKEKKNLVIELTQVYKKEYYLLKIEEKSELTAVENIMNKWVKQGNTTAKKIAIQALVYFTKLSEEKINE